MTRVCLLSPEPIRAHMAGVGIRYLEMARSLARHHEVRLVASEVELEPEASLPFTTARFADASFAELAAGADVIVVHGHVSTELLAALDSGLGPRPRLVMDLYDPFHVENLHYAPALGPDALARDLAVLREQLRRGDYFLCATPAQRLYYLGMLAAEGRIRPGRFLQDPGLEGLVGIVPFGVPRREPKPARPVLRGVVPGIGRDDYVIFYGGVYDWQDPLTALRALERLMAEPAPGGAIKLVFAASPNVETTPKGKLEEARALSREKGWHGDVVHFVEWLRYDEREAAYLESDLGLVTARHGLEVELSFRTRVLDWLWAGLPAVVTEGGYAARLLQDEKAGVVVPPADPDRLAEAVRRLRSAPEEARAMAERGRLLARSRFTWDTVVEPLDSFCRAAAADVPSGEEAHEATAVTPRVSGAPTVSVVVPNYNGAALLARCLPSLLDLDFPAERLEILVVDNGSTDGSKELVTSYGPRVRLVANPRNEGFCRAVNLGVERSGGELVAFLNNDTRVEPLWLRSMTERLLGGGDGVAAVAGKLMSFDGSRLDFGRGVMMFDAHAIQPDYGLESELEPYRESVETFIACGGNMLVRRADFLALGGFDADYFAYLEDVDFSWRLWSSGRRILFEPKGVAFHHSSATSGKMDPYDREFLNERNAFMTLVKNVDDEHFPRLFASGLLALLHRHWRLVAAVADERDTLGRYPFTRDGYRPHLEGPTAVPSLTIRHPQGIAHLRVVHYLLENLDGLLDKRLHVQAQRIVPDRELFRRFPPYLVPTYEGDDALFRSRFFQWLLPVEPVRALLEELSHR